MLLASMGCAAPAPSRAEVPDERAHETVTGILRSYEPPPQAPGKPFIGVRLERDDGTDLVVAYGSDSLWAAFDGQRVEATGHPYVPEGQALMAPHFRIETLRVVDEGAALLAVGPERSMEGTFVVHTVPRGRKRAGERVVEFVERNGTRWNLEHSPSPPPLDRPVQIRARRVDPNWAYAARMAGRYLWVVEVTAR